MDISINTDMSRLTNCCRHGILGRISNIKLITTTFRRWTYNTTVHTTYARMAIK